MEISAEKSEIIANSTEGVNTNIFVTSQELERVNQSKCLGAIISEEELKIKII